MIQQIALPVFSAGGPCEQFWHGQGATCEQFWHGQGCPLFHVVQPAFPLPATALPTLQDALKDGFREAVVACDVPKQCKFPFLDSCQKRFLWMHKEDNLALHPVIGHVLKEQDAEIVSSETWF